VGCGGTTGIIITGGKYKIYGVKCPSQSQLVLLVKMLSMGHWWNDFYRGKRKYWEKIVSQ
jgi:hypothetical protein